MCTVTSTCITVAGILAIGIPGSGIRVAGFNLNSGIEQVVPVLVLEKSRYLSVTLIQRNGARRFGPCFDAQSQQTEHEHDF